MCPIMSAGAIGAGYDHRPGRTCDDVITRGALCRHPRRRSPDRGRAQTSSRAPGRRTPYRDRHRSPIVLDAARGYSNARIARLAGRRRGPRARGAAGSRGHGPGPGRPAPVRSAPADQRGGTGRGRRAGAAELPAATGVPLSRWSCPELPELSARPGSDPVSATSLLRILAEHPVKPWRYQSWIFARDPTFATKATVIFDLYEGFYQVVSRSAPGIGSSPSTPSRPSRPRPHPRHLAARPGQATGSSMSTSATARSAAASTSRPGPDRRHPADHGHRPVHGTGRSGHGPAGVRHRTRVFVIVDNGSDHRGQAAIGRLARARPNAIMIHTPVHASWLNQIEIFFSIIQKKVVSPNDFASLSCYPRPCSPSSIATTGPRSHSTGNSPQPIWPTCSTASASTRPQPPRARPILQQQRDPPRTYGATH